MATFSNLETADGLTFRTKTTNLDGVTTTISLRNFQDNGDTLYWQRFAKGFANEILEHFLEQTPTVILRISASGLYQNANNGGELGVLTMQGSKIKAYRHRESRVNRISGALDYVFDPDNFTHGDAGGSVVGSLLTVSQINLTFEFPLVYNVNGLASSFRLREGVLPKAALDFLPFNNDFYCVMHCLFTKLNQGVRLDTTLNNNKQYMDRFNAWFKEHNLDRFYIEHNKKTYFSIDCIVELEEELKTNINWYTVEKSGPVIHYRSEYKHSIYSIINLVILDLDFFYNKNDKNAVKTAPKKFTNCISVTAPTEGYAGKVSVQNFLPPHLAHCAVLDTNVFQIVDSNGVKRNGKICRFCNKNLKNQIALDRHEGRCHSTFLGKSEAHRARAYREVLSPDKVFKNFSALAKVPFATWDFETRQGPNGEHIPLSFSILYFYPFNLSRSRAVLKLNQDPEALLEDFCKELEETARYHHNMQCVEFTLNPDIRDTTPHPKSCPWCLKKDLKEFDWNHSHFLDDQLNDSLETWICHDCNVKATLRNKPLKFMAHNGSKFDFNLVIGAVLNSGRFKGFDFLAKSESRFTQVAFNVAVDSRFKISLNDSMLLLAGSLGRLAHAWIKPTDVNKIATLLERYYPNRDTTELAKISLGKQVFPYSALDNEEMLTRKLIPRESFFNTLTGKEISDEDYTEYLKASSILEEFIGESFTFRCYHDFYLQLDAILLACCLDSFVETCYSGVGNLNPLAYLSTSSYTMGSLLYHNLQAGLPTIKIPRVEVQQFLQKSIKGGFTHVFNRQITNGADFATYVDVNSLYPSVMATKKLPYEFVGWINNPTTSVLKKLNNPDLYYFLEVDIAPLAEEFQDKVSRYPMFPESFTVTPEHVSADQKYRFEIGHGKPLKEETLNTVTFYEKKNYVCTMSYLHQALEVGYQVTKIHRVAIFKASYIMADYVKKIYELKRLASIERDNLDKDDPDFSSKKAALDSKISAYKLVANGLFGSTVVNSERFSETIVFESSETEMLRKQLSSFRYKSLLHLDDKVLVNKHRTSYTLEYPLCIGSAILAESKLIIAKFVYTLYDWLKKEDLTLEINMMDTDSVVFSIPNVLDVFYSIDHMASAFNQECYSAFDTTYAEPEEQMPKTHQAFSHFKNETAGKKITSFNGLAAKCYSYTVEGGKTVVKGKGIPEATQAQVLGATLYSRVISGEIFDDYLDEETGKTNYLCQYNTINSNKTQLRNKTITKAYVTLVDLKNHYEENGVTPAIYGSKLHLDRLKG